MEKFYLNKSTGELEERMQMGEFGNIWLSDTEIRRLDNYALKNDVFLPKIIDDADIYIEYHWDELPLSFPYLRAWIDRVVNFRERYCEKYE